MSASILRDEAIGCDQELDWRPIGLELDVAQVLERNPEAEDSQEPLACHDGSGAEEHVGLHLSKHGERVAVTRTS